ncbi:M20/M25/M40 family metallo-hydrolase [Pseudoxanthomonas sp. SGD-10]|nr:M20/M25/M40 family metallo-hydrolase [Pseudoxanthomonas sp. SGD-10]
MKHTLKARTCICLVFSIFWICACRAQAPDINISAQEVTRILSTLASDEMRGRNPLVPEDIEKASSFIIEEFKKAGLKPFDSVANSYVQPLEHKYKGKQYQLHNILGILPGKSKPEEYVIFSAHYDHIGIINAVGQDSIANGADDNASGVTAVIKLAKHYAEKGNNERTLIFAAFTAEEIGFVGSEYFAQQINLKQIVAMFNIEMIGKVSKFGKNTAFITGYQYSNLGKIMSKNLEGTNYKLYPDPYPMQQLFFRSDNRPLAARGVTAHTISSVQINKDKTYHTVKDEVNQLDIDNIVSVIKAIAIGSETVVSGKDTPSKLRIR